MKKIFKNSGDSSSNINNLGYKSSTEPVYQYGDRGNPDDWDDYFGKEKDCCDKPDKYKNIVSKNLKFWSCKNCGADLGDVE